jgi:hypothetical protein
MAILNKLESLADRVEALEKLTVLRGYGKANTLQAKAIKFVTDNQRARGNHRGTLPLIVVAST